MYKRDLIAGLFSFGAAILLYRYLNELWFSQIVDDLKPYLGALRSEYFPHMFIAVGSIAGIIISLGLRIKGDWDRVIVRVMSGPILLLFLSLRYMLYYCVSLAVSILLFLLVQHTLKLYREEDV